MKALTLQLKNIPLFLAGICLTTALMNAAQCYAGWTSGGPYGSYYINGLTIARTNPDVIYAGTEKSGVLKTVDGGDTWTKTSFPKTLVRVVQVAPHNPDIVYAGTDDGIYKTQDGGSTWSQKGLSGARVNAIAIDHLNPLILHAGTGWKDKDFEGEIFGIFKSTDGGETWQEKLSDGLQAVMTLIIDADNPSHIYAGVCPYPSYPWYNDDGLRKSTDRGETWVSKHLHADIWNSETVHALAMTTADSNTPVIYALTSGGIYDETVHKSTDRGESWTPTNTQPFGSVTPSAIAVDPNDPDVVYVGSYSLKKTIDGGGTWAEKANSLPASKLSSIVIDPQNSAVLYVGLSEGGIHKSTDGAESWNSSTPPTRLTSIVGLAVHPTSSDTVSATIKGNECGLARTSDGGTSWDYLIGLPTNLGAVAIDPQNPSTIWVGDGERYVQRFYVYKSKDNGKSWESINFLSFSPDSSYSKISDILIKADDSDSILVGVDFLSWVYGIAGSGILARTTDGGVNWQNLGGPTSALAADPNNPNVVYTGKRRIGQVFRYSNVWENWTTEQITPSEGIGDIRDIEVDSDSKVYVAASDGLWMWDGANWTTLTAPSSNDITALTIDRSTNPGIIYAGTAQDGVYVSLDGGITWTTFNGGLGSLSIEKLAISASQPRILYAGTDLGGVWSRLLVQIVNGDVNGNGTVSLEDAILVLQVLTGTNPMAVVYKQADVNGDGKIGIAEVLYILQKVCGLRGQ